MKILKIFHYIDAALMFLTRLLAYLVQRRTGLSNFKLAKIVAWVPFVSMLISVAGQDKWPMTALALGFAFLLSAVYYWHVGRCEKKYVPGYINMEMFRGLTDRLALICLYPFLLWIGSFRISSFLVLHSWLLVLYLKAIEPLAPMSRTRKV